MASGSSPGSLGWIPPIWSSNRYVTATSSGYRGSAPRILLVPKSAANPYSQNQNHRIQCAYPTDTELEVRMKEVGTEIRRLREERGWTGAQLAVYAGMAPSAVSQIETGRRSPNTGSLAKIAKALGVEVVDLFPKGQVPLPLDDASSLEELHAAAGCETDWLICPEATWWTTWPAEPCPQEAMERVRETATELAKLRPLMAEQEMAEQERGLRPSQTKFGGHYQQAWRRFFDTLQEAKARGVAAGIITDEETLDDLEERLVGQPSHYLDAFLRAS